MQKLQKFAKDAKDAKMMLAPLFWKGIAMVMHNPFTP